MYLRHMGLGGVSATSQYCLREASMAGLPLATQVILCIHDNGQR